MCICKHFDYRFDPLAKIYTEIYTECNVSIFVSNPNRSVLRNKESQDIKNQSRGQK